MERGFEAQALLIYNALFIVTLATIKSSHAPTLVSHRPCHSGTHCRRSRSRQSRHRASAAD